MIYTVKIMKSIYRWAAALLALMLIAAEARGSEITIDFTSLDEQALAEGPLTEATTFALGGAELTLPAGSTLKTGWLSVPKGAEIALRPVDRRIISEAKWSFTAANYGKFARLRTTTLSEPENTTTVNATYTGGALTMTYTVATGQELRAKKLELTLSAAPLRQPLITRDVVTYTDHAVVQWHTVAGARGYRLYVGDESLFDESFDDTSRLGGNDGILAGRGSGLSFPMRLSNFGWSQSGTVSADSCLRVGSPSSTGWVTTPAIPISEGVVLFFRAVTVGGTEDCVTLTVNGSTEDVAVRSDRFTAVTRRVQPDEQGALQATFAKYALADRLYLDDVKVIADRGTYRAIDILDPNAASYAIDGLQPGRRYSCWLMALGDGVESYDSQCTATLEIALPERHSGDINGDGAVDSSDVSALLEMVLSGTDAVTPEADLNGDGAIDSNDVAALLEQVLAGG